MIVSLVSLVVKLVFVREILRLGTTNTKRSKELPNAGPIRNILRPYPPEHSME